MPSEFTHFDWLLQAIKQDTDECILWPFGCYTNGYGRLYVRQIRPRHEAAHRVTYKLVHGSIPDGKMICHTCDVRPCINPRHLFAGTARDNTHDAIRKGRLSHGENHYNHKLTTTQVDEIRTLYVPHKIRLLDLAVRYGVTESHIFNIVVGRKRTKG